MWLVRPEGSVAYRDLTKILVGRASAGSVARDNCQITPGGFASAFQAQHIDAAALPQHAVIVYAGCG